MDKDSKLLICRISWMQEYRSESEKAFSYHKYIIAQNTPYEALNFLIGDDGIFRGYVPVRGDAESKFSKINIARLGGARDADRVKGVTVVFCAPHELQGGLRVVGFYRNATVLREPAVSNLPNRTKVTRVFSNDAVLIPVEDRVFTIPGRHDGGMGQSSLWYGMNEGHPLQEDLLRYLADTQALPASQASVIEHRRRKIHEQWEGRGASRAFIQQKGFCCEACGYTIAQEDQKIWGSGFDLHHLLPWSDMMEDTERELTVDDFAVLCATCHRAIHRSDYVSDVPQFRLKILEKRIIIALS